MRRRSIRPTAAEQIADYALVVTSPGFPPTAPVLAAAAAAGVPVWGDVELAWRLDQAGRYGPPRRWLVVTGTNGKTTTTSMLHAMLDRRRAPDSLLCGNIGEPGARRAAISPPSCWPSSCPASSCTGRRRCGPRPGWCSTSPRTTWTGTARMDDYAAAKAARTRRPGGGRRARRPGRGGAAGRPPPRRSGSASGSASPAPGELGVRDGMLVDSAFARRRLALAPVASIPVPGPVGVLDALAAAALARGVGVPPRRDRRRRWRRSRWAGTAPRWSPSSTASRYVDDSKATNPHAAEASVLAYPRVVWIAGGLLKGASVDETGRRGRRLGWSGRC